MTILLYILVVVFGFYSFQNLPLALMPSMEVPAAVVYATYPGAGPEDIEQQVTKKLEGAVAGLSGLDTLQSTSSENMAMLVIRFTNDTDMDQAMTDLRDKVAQVKSQLPDDASDPTVMSIDIDSMPVVSVALRGNDLASLQSIAEDEIQPALERLDGVASVDISGGYEQEIAVHTDASRLKGYNLTISSIGQQLGADNIAIPGGDLDNGSQTLAVRTDGEYSSIDDVKNALISLPAGGTVRLSQIADVSMQPKDQDAISKVDGEECIILSVNKQSGSNTAQIAELAKAEFDSLLKSNDSLQWNIVMDQSDYINMTVDNAIQNIWMGVLFAVLISVTFGFAFNSVQSNTICAAWEGAFGADHVWVGVVLTALTLLIIFGGIRRIARVSGVIVPIMALGYIVLALGVVLFNLGRLPEVLELIVADAFGWEQTLGGAVGAALMQGIKRGLFSNEAGMGSAPNVAATAHVSHPVKQGLIQTLGVFTDTLVICTCTAFIILFGGVPDASLNGIQLTQAALESEIGPAGGVFVAVAIFLFAFSSIIGNYYYGEANIRFITPRPWALTLYRLLVGAMVLFGSVATLDLAWSLADVTMALMTLCNLAAIVLLGRQAFLLLADYTAQKRQGIKNPVFTKDRIPELKDKAECW